MLRQEDVLWAAFKAFDVQAEFFTVSRVLNPGSLFGKLKGHYLKHGGDSYFETNPQLHFGHLCCLGKTRLGPWLFRPESNMIFLYIDVHRTHLP